MVVSAQGTRLFCDFDTSNQNNTAANSNIWKPVTLGDYGGKMTSRHNAFFLGDDGSQSQPHISPLKSRRGSSRSMTMSISAIPPFRWCLAKNRFKRFRSR
jgi:hypothetical protein